jgi:small subunit ribosomal protein S9
MEAVTKKAAAPKADKPAKKPAAAKKPRAAKAPKADKAEKLEEVKVDAVVETPAAEVDAAPKFMGKVPSGKNFHGVGRRKTSVAQANLTAGKGEITVNKLKFEQYFQTDDLQRIIRHPMVSIGIDTALDIRSKVSGGGIHSQAEALRHAISRALIILDPESRRTLKKLGFLKRDPRVKERKKPGLKRARRAPQFSKR